jgi:hypothetical protein
VLGVGLKPLPALAQGSFLRGNSNGDVAVDISDAVYTLAFLFLGGPSPSCRDAADANDDGAIDISDAVYTLAFLFLGGPAPPPPGPTVPGPDPTEDALPCRVADTEPPSPATDLAISPPSGSNDNDPELTGSGEPDATVHVFAEADEGAGGVVQVPCSGQLTESGVAEGNGRFRVVLRVADDTTTTFSVQLIDAAGNASDCSEPIVYVEDSTPPAIPVIVGTVPASPSSERSPRVAGTAEPNAAITVFLDADCSGAPAAVGEAGGDGAFSLQVTVPIGSTTALAARAADRAGNESACSAAASYTHIAGAPATQLDFSQQPGSATAGRPFWLGVAARDDASNLDPAFTGVVTIAIGQGPAGAVLSGTSSGAAEDGVFRTGDVTLDLAGTYTLTASSPGLAGDETRPFVVLSPGTAPSVVSLTTSGDTGCVELRYRLAHPGSQRAKVLIEFSPDAQSPFQVATPAGAGAIFNLRTAPQPGVIHRFLWNSSVDLTGDTSTARIRVTPFLASDGTPGVPFTREDVVIDWNRLALLPANQLASPGVTDIAAGDLNNDGRADFASTDTSADTVTVHFQDSFVTGFFSSTAVVGTGDGPAAVRIADFDRDGRQDLIVVLSTAGEVQVLRNNGAGGFTAAATGSTEAAPAALAVADVDGDARIDAVTTNVVLLQDAAGGFQPARTFDPGPSRTDVSIADFNRDGALDLATVNFVDRSVTIYHQDPLSPGTFLESESLTLTGSPTAIEAADLNSDGRVDLVVVLRDGDALNTFYGQENGFAAEPPVPVRPGTAQNDVAIADLDGDLRPDIATAGSNGPGIYVQRPGDPETYEDSSGSAFNPGVQLTVVATHDWSSDGVPDVVWASSDAGALYPQQSRPSLCESPIPLPQRTSFNTEGATSLATGFINGDGFADAVVGGGDTVSIFAGGGDGRFGIATFFQEGGETTAVLLPDVDNDGDADVVWTTTNSVFVSKSNSESGSFEPPVVSHPGGGVAAAVGQFTADARVDLVVAGATELAVLAGNGAGGFNPVSTTPAALTSLATGDLNGNGTVDVVGAVPAAGAFQVFTGDGQGNLTPDIDLPDGLDPGRVVVFDANGDGQQDVAGASRGGGFVHVYLRGRDGKLERQLGVIVGDFLAQEITAGDINGDEIPDLVVADAHTDTVAVFEGRGDGRFRDSGLRLPLGSDVVGVDLATLDGDLTPDLVVTDRNGIITVRSGDVRIFADFYGYNPTPGSDRALGDIDGDGQLDDISVSTTSAEATIVLGLLTAMPERRTIPVGTGVSTGTLGDVNRDGMLDLILTYSTGENGRVLFGDGAGGFTTAGEFTQGFNDVADAVLGDLNRDGNQDLALANRSGNQVATLLGNGAGAFAFHDATVTGNQPADIEFADVNQDGIQDLFTANTGSDTVTVHVGDGTGRFVLHLTLSNLPSPMGVAAGDVQRDGRIDLAVAHSLIQPDLQSITFFPGTSPPGTFGPGARIFTGDPTQDVFFSGNFLVGFNEQTVSRYEHTGGSFFNLPEVFVVPVVLNGAPKLVDPSEAERVRIETGVTGCAVGRFEHLGGPTVQRLATLLTILLPLVALDCLRRRERRRRER